MKTKKNKLPKYWVVKCDGSQLYRDTVGEYLNKLAIDNIVKNYKGSDNLPNYWQSDGRFHYWNCVINNRYYGYDGNPNNFGGGNSNYSLEGFSNSPSILTLDKFIEFTKVVYTFQDMLDGKIIIENDNREFVKELLNTNNFLGRKNWYSGFKYYSKYTGDYKIDIEKYPALSNLPLIKATELKEHSQNKNMNEFEITRTQLKKIHDIACPDWKKKIINLGAKNPLEEKIILVQAEVDEMFKEATEIQKPVLESIFGKQVEEIDLRTGKIDGRELFNNFGEYTNKGVANSAIMGIRTVGKYANKAIFLDRSYKWEIIEDIEGHLCLVPTRK